MKHRFFSINYGVRTAQLYGGWDGFREIVAAHVTLPDGVSLDDVLQCFDCNYGNGDFQIDDQNAYTTALQEQVVAPMQLLQTLIESRPYVTRLYTTLSAEEMTVDPSFDFNPDLPDVDNVHMATRTVHCSSGFNVFDAPWSVKLPQGGTVRGTGVGNWPFSTDGDMPANLRILEVGNAGLGTVVTDNSATIASLIESSNRAQGLMTGGGGDCSIAHSSRNLASILVALFALVWLRRRSRRKRQMHRE